MIVKYHASGWWLTSHQPENCVSYRSDEKEANADDEFRQAFKVVHFFDLPRLFIPTGHGILNFS